MEVPPYNTINEKPNVICVEYRINTDTASLRNSYDERLNAIEEIRKEWNIPQGNVHVGAIREELNKLKGSYKVLTLSDVLSKHE
jgi:hypothetical protein